MNKDIIIRKRVPVQSPGKALAVGAADPAHEIIRLHDGILRQYDTARRDILKSAIRIGELLTTQKENLGHGLFGKWIEDNLSDIGVREAQNYMRIFDNRKRLESEKVDTIRGAVALLKSPSNTKRVSHLQDDTDELLPVINADLLFEACGREKSVFDAVKKRLAGHFDVAEMKRANVGRMV